MTDPNAILRAVCTTFGVSLAELVGPRRFSRLTPARHAAAWALRKAGLGVVEAGEALHRDHTTVIYSVRRAEALAERDPAYAAQLAALVRAGRVTPPVPPVPPARPGVAMTPALRLWVAFSGLMMPTTA